jgi:hypothetical protein
MQICRSGSHLASMTCSSSPAQPVTTAQLNLLGFNIEASTVYCDTILKGISLCGTPRKNVSSHTTNQLVRAWWISAVMPSVIRIQFERVVTSYSGAAIVDISRGNSVPCTGFFFLSIIQYAMPFGKQSARCRIWDSHSGGYEQLRIQTIGHNHVHYHPAFETISGSN